MVTIISKRPINDEIVEYHFDESRMLYEKVRSVTILGGAGVIDPHTLVTPEGVATEITDEAYEWLKKQRVYAIGVESGEYRAIEHTRARTVDADEIASSGKMEKNENIGGRPMTPEMLKEQGAVVNKDGSVDITEGGKSAPSIRDQHLDSVRRARKNNRTRK